MLHFTLMALVALAVTTDGQVSFPSFRNSSSCTASNGKSGSCHEARSTEFKECSFFPSTDIRDPEVVDHLTQNICRNDGREIYFCCPSDRSPLDESSCIFEDFQKQKTHRHKRNVEECKWIVKGTCYPKNPPIFVNVKDPTRLLLPLHEEDGENRVRVKVGEKLFLSCPGRLPYQQNKFNNEDFDTPYIEATCENDGDLHVNGKITVCFQHKQKEQTATALWSKNTLRGFNIAAADTERLKGFKVDPGFYSPKIDKEMEIIYSQKAQKNYLMTNGINQELLWEKFNKYTRGHLASRYDFVTQAESDATFHYINVLPQWIKYNGANWGVIEKWVVDLAKKLGHDLEIYTGGYSVVDLKYGDKNLIYYLGNIVGYQEMGVPAAFWKLVIDKTQNRAVVFIINNNPLENKVIPGIKCNEETCKKKFTGLKVDNAENGFTLCCELDDPKNIFPPNMPNIAHNFPLLNLPQK